MHKSLGIVALTTLIAAGAAACGRPARVGYAPTYYYSSGYYSPPAVVAVPPPPTVVYQRPAVVVQQVQPVYAPPPSVVYQQPGYYYGRRPWFRGNLHINLTP